MTVTEDFVPAGGNRESCAQAPPVRDGVPLALAVRRPRRSRSRRGWRGRGCDRRGRGIRNLSRRTRQGDGDAHARGTTARATMFVVMVVCFFMTVPSSIAPATHR